MADTIDTVNTEQQIDYVRQMVNKVNLPDCEVGHTDEMNPFCSGMAVARFYVTHAKKSILGCNNTLQIVLEGLEHAHLCPCGRAEKDCLRIFPI